MLNNAAAAAAGGPDHHPSVPASFKHESEPFYPQPAGMPDPSASSSAGPIRIDGWEQDAAEFLTRQEVLKRRSRRIKQICSMFKNIYWDWFVEGELRSKAREYYWEFGSPFVEEKEELNEMINYNEDLGVNGGNRTCNVWSRCGMRGCKAKAMALTSFCHMHILHDENQKLYKECTFTIKGSISGPIQCGKPALQSTVPCYCPVHFQTAERLVVRALKKHGLNVASTRKLAPKLHVLVSSYVHQIQQKRRSATKKANLENGQIKMENKL